MNELADEKVLDVVDDVEEVIQLGRRPSMDGKRRIQPKEEQPVNQVGLVGPGDSSATPPQPGEQEALLTSMAMSEATDGDRSAQQLIADQNRTGKSPADESLASNDHTRAGKGRRMDGHAGTGTKAAGKKEEEQKGKGRTKRKKRPNQADLEAFMFKSRNELSQFD